jgi:hypothetical protein
MGDEKQKHGKKTHGKIGATRDRHIIKEFGFVCLFVVVGRRRRR